MAFKVFLILVAFLAISSGERRQRPRGPRPRGPRPRISTEELNERTTQCIEENSDDVQGSLRSNYKDFSRNLFQDLTNFRCLLQLDVDEVDCDETENFGDRIPGKINAFIARAFCGVAIQDDEVFQKVIFDFDKFSSNFFIQGTNGRLCGRSDFD